MQAGLHWCCWWRSAEKEAAVAAVGTAADKIAAAAVDIESAEARVGLHMGGMWVESGGVWSQ